MIIDSAMKAHTTLGPGMLESVYEKCLKHELKERGLRVESQGWLPVIYDGEEIEGGYKIDLLVEDEVIVELKVVEHLLELHRAQLLSYLKLSNEHVGLLINFNVVHLRDGIRRLVNNYKPSTSTAVLVLADEQMKTAEDAKDAEVRLGEGDQVARS